jgi:hypothetical protein
MCCWLTCTCAHPLQRCHSDQGQDRRHATPGDPPMTCFPFPWCLQQIEGNLSPNHNRIVFPLSWNPTKNPCDKLQLEIERPWITAVNATNSLPCIRTPPYAFLQSSWAATFEYYRPPSPCWLKVFRAWLIGRGAPPSLAPCSSQRTTRESHHRPPSSVRGGYCCQPVPSPPALQNFLR